MTLHLSDSAFLTITCSAVEAYKKECYGLILGYRTDTQWRVELAVPYLTAERGHNTVTPHSKRDRRVRGWLRQVSSYEQLGTFHSHPAWGRLRALAKPSKPDQEFHTPGDLDIIVAVNDAVCARRFHHGDRGRLLSGTVGDYSLSIAAYYKPPIGDQQLRRTLISCPTAVGFNPRLSLK